MMLRITTLEEALEAVLKDSCNFVCCKRPLRTYEVCLIANNKSVSILGSSIPVCYIPVHMVKLIENKALHLIINMI